MMKAGALYVTSIAAHGVLAAGLLSLEAKSTRETVAISVVEAKKPTAAVEAPPPAPSPPREPREAPAKAKAAPAPKPAPPSDPPPAAAPPGASDGSSVPDFGLALGNATGGGLALPAAPAAAQPSPTAAPERVSRKVLAAPSASAPECAEPPKKPKVVSIAQPAYTAEAREAKVAGKVRIEVTVDARGQVASARVLEGLGHGLDDAALAAARSATFEPGTRCGQPASATFVIAIRFAL